MTKEELSDLVERVNLLWRSDMTMADKKALKGVWWEYLHDLEAGRCKTIIDQYNLRGDWAPKPGDVRRLYLLKSVPTHMDCWAEMRERYTTINSGGFWEDSGEVHELTQSIIRRLGEEGAKMHTNGDRSEFKAVYEQELGTWIERVCQLKPLPK